MYHRKRDENRVGIETSFNDTNTGETHKTKPPEIIAQPKQSVQVHVHVHANVDVQVSIGFCPNEMKYTTQFS